VRVEIDGKPLPAELINLARSANPGTHVVHAAADGFEPVERTVTVAKGESVPVEIVLTASATGSESAAGEASALSWNAQRRIAVVSAGLGVVTLVVGGVVAVEAKTQYDNASPGCDASGCTLASFNERNAARDKGKVASILGVAGGAVVAGSAVAWFTAPKTTSPRVAIGMGVGGVTPAIVLRGIF
jgi:hypothetical protein